MAIFKPTYKDRKTGETRQSRKYWLEHTVDGVRTLTPLGVRDQNAAHLKAGEVIRKIEMKRAGLVDPFEEQRGRPIEEHLADFEHFLRAKGTSAVHLDDRMKVLRAFVKAADAEILGDLDGADAVAYLNAMKARSLSARTRNRHRAAFRQFGRWCVRQTPRRLPFDPFEGLPVANEDADRRHVRSPLSLAEVETVVSVMACGPWHRRVIYLVASEAGLRRSELAGLLWRDFDLDAAVVTVQAKLSKNRSEAHLPLSARTVEALRALQAEKGEVESPNAKVFGGHIPTEGGKGPGPRYGVPNLKTFYADLKRAGIVHHKRPDGTVIDLHALARTSLATNAARSGIPLATTQRIMRHSTPILTARSYTKLDASDLRAALEKLQPAPEGESHKSGGRSDPGAENERPFKPSARGSSPLALTNSISSGGATFGAPTPVADAGASVRVSPLASVEICRASTSGPTRQSDREVALRDLLAQAAALLG